jgi:transcription initiation factor IIE alpha subunit
LRKQLSILAENGTICFMENSTGKIGGFKYNIMTNTREFTQVAERLKEKV